MDFHSRSAALLSAGVVIGSVMAFGLFLRAPQSVVSTIASVTRSSTPRVVSAPEKVMTVSSSLPKASFDRAFETAETWSVKSGTRVILVPHHLVAARQIASLMKAVETPRLVYLVSPDHYSQGKTVFTTTSINFETIAGTVSGDASAVSDLTGQVSDVRSTETPFTTERGVTDLLSFMSRNWPDAKVVPIIVRLDAKPEQIADLSSYLASQLEKHSDALLVTTVDFSHYMTEPVANMHDILARDVVTSLADLETLRVELDSPGALAVGLQTARRLGLGDVTIHAHTNSADILQAPDTLETTSHVFASFAPGPVQSQQDVTLLFTGDMMFDRNVAGRSKTAGALDYPFEKIRGAENRFFRGYDAVVANLEGPVTSERRVPDKEIDFAFDPKIVPMLKQVGITAVSQANNHTLDQGRAGADESRALIEAGGVSVFGDEYRVTVSSSLKIIESRGQRVALIGFNTTEMPLDREAALRVIEAAKAQTPHVIVFMHWGEEYHKPNATQVNLAHWFIDNGVEAVIGAHPHWMESVERYNGHLIAYSLGNFIFDQDFSAETRYGLVGGVVLRPEGDELHLFPVKIMNSQPQLLVGNERKARLEHLADISDPALRRQIENGVLYTR